MLATILKRQNITFIRATNLSRWYLGLSLVAVLIFGSAGVVAWNFERSPAPDSDAEVVGPIAAELSQAEIEELRPQVDAFCGACHAVPPADSFPKSAWRREVQRGYEFYQASGRTDLQVPLQAKVAKYFRAQAPESLVFAKPVSGSTGIKPAFTPQDVTMPFANSQSQRQAFMIAHINAGTVAQQSPTRESLFVCDMRSSWFSEISVIGSELTLRRQIKAGHPADVVETDLDDDQKTDWVIADLGSFLPQDHDRGRVLWVRSTGNHSFAEPLTLVEGLGRVASVRAGDFNGDGRVDLLVAEFGWQTSGRTLIFYNQGGEDGLPKFEQQIIDPRHGVIHAEPIDLNSDGLLDFVALISQEHETIVAFINDGDNKFRQEVIFAAPHPAFGSSGIRLVDLDGDSDTDVLYTNGDMYDSFELKPYHGVRWIENLGRGEEWLHHEIARMPGVLSAVPADFNGDGLIDIIACASVPDSVLEKHSTLTLDSLLLLQQTTGNQFVPHSLERDQCHHPCVEVGDFDRDGDVDFVVGNMTNSTHPDAAYLRIWWNEGPGKVASVK
jgi:hypothetical protein